VALWANAYAKWFLGPIPFLRLRRLPGATPVQCGRSCESCVRFVDGREAMRLFVVGLLFVSFLPSSQQQNPSSAAATPTCHEFSFEGRVNGGEEYSRELGGGLSIHLSPSLAPKNENWGWVIQVRPLDSTADYAFPVNPPFHSENSQWLSTGYGETVEQQLVYEHEVFFVLKRKEYEDAAKLVEEAMSSTEPEAAGKFISALPSLRSAVLRLRPIKYETSDGGKTAKWMSFGVVVIAPANFQPAPGLNAKDVACSAARLA
jgi:hypothetical protein